MADKAVIPIAIGAVFVRIGNFINNEIIGRISDFIFSIDINGEKRHPSQLYESLKNLLIFGILLFLNKKKRRDGFIFWMFILLFGIFRFIVEFWKEGGLYFGLTNGQWLSIPVTLIGLFFMRKIYK